MDASRIGLVGCGPAALEARARDHRVRSRVPGLLLLAILGACQAPGPVFTEMERPDLVWPPPPAAARIRWAGLIGAPADGKPGRNVFEDIGTAVFGSPEPERIDGPRAAVRTRDLERVWIADPGGRCAHVVDLAGRPHRRIAKAGERELLSPVGVCIGPGDTVFLCDSEAVAIHRFAGADGRWLGDLVLPPELLRPVAVAWEPVAAELYVVDAVAHDVKVLREDGTPARTLGTRGTAPGTFNFPCAVAVESDRVWIADAGNCRVQALTPAGAPLLSIGRAGDAPGDLAMPKGVAVDSDGHLYVVDARFENVQVFDREGRLLTMFGEEGADPGRFCLPSGISIDAADRIWICDSHNRRVQAFDYLKAGNGDGR